MRAFTSMTCYLIHFSPCVFFAVTVITYNSHITNSAGKCTISPCALHINNLLIDSLVTLRFLCWICKSPTLYNSHIINAAGKFTISPCIVLHQQLFNWFVCHVAFLSWNKVNHHQLHKSSLKFVSFILVQVRVYINDMLIGSFLTSHFFAETVNHSQFILHQYSW